MPLLLIMVHKQITFSYIFVYVQIEEKQENIVIHIEKEKVMEWILKH